MSATDASARQRAADLVIAAAREHMRARVAEGGLRSIEVPEWPAADGSGPTVIYYRPVMTMQQRHRIDAKISDGRIPTIVEGLLVRALDAEGRPLFADADRHALMLHMDSDVLMRIASEIVTGSVMEPTLEAIEEN
jgi:hypothetical protein